MRKMIFAVFILGLFGAMHAFAQGQDFSKVEMKVQKVAGSVYMIEGAGGNIGASVGDDGTSLSMMSFCLLPIRLKLR